MTALVILVSGVPLSGEGVGMALAAYGAVLGRAAPPILALSILLFAFATVLCWSHYGAESLAYLTNHGKSHRLMTIPIAVSAVVGGVAASEFLWELTDLVIALMAVINIAALLAKRRDVIEETELLYAPARVKERNDKRC
jgi:AGCS family alanine or glycine:cation symporter